MWSFTATTMVLMKMLTAKCVIGIIADETIGILADYLKNRLVEPLTIQEP